MASGFLIYRSFGLGFDQTADAVAADILQDNSKNSRAIYTALAIWLVYIACLELVGESLRTYLSIPSPSDLLNGMYNIIARLGRESQARDRFGIHVLVSLLNLFGGLTFALVIALSTCKVLVSNEMLRQRILWALPMTSIALAMLPYLLLTSGLVYGSAYVMLTVASLAFFCCVQCLLGLREQVISVRILFTVGRVLPLSFMATIFGEAISSTVGVGFFAVINRTTNEGRPIGLGSALLSLGLVLGISSTIHFLGSKTALSSK
jgi:ABC-type nitrate/sulfonate/bicarbonate transport system permease component